MSRVILRPLRQQKVLRLLLLGLPVIILYPFLIWAQVIFLRSVPGFVFNEFFAALLSMCSLMAVAYVSMLCARDVVLSGEENNMNVRVALLSKPLSELIEVAGDDGDLQNDFRECLIFRFKDESESLIYVDEFDEGELRRFLGVIKESAPECDFSYSEVIHLESRGLLRFLHTTSDIDSLIIKQSKTPTEDLALQLFKEHQKPFFIIYSAMWLLVICAAAYFGTVGQRELLLTGGVQSLVLDPSQAVISVGNQLANLAVNGFWDQLHQWWLSVVLFFALALKYLGTEGIEYLTLIWTLLGFALVVVAPVIRSYTPTYVFVDSVSIGMGRTFFTWEEVTSVSLNKMGKFADPLEGELLVRSNESKTLTIKLSRIPDETKRHSMLRLVERYATEATFNEEFLRTTNVMVDIQFTDIWLSEMEQSTGETKAVSQGAETVGGGRFAIRSVLGYGGQGTTYLAECVAPEDASADPSAISQGETVVVKEIVLPGYADVRIMQDAIRRFQSAAELLTGLRHPQIVALHEHFMDGDKAYLVMEHVEGESLRSLIEREGKQPLSRVLEMGLQLCDILQYLHTLEKPIIHCDFAPDNLIMDETGKLKLLDFDVARPVDSRNTAFVAARPSYTPPEQFRGAPTLKSDIFALGAILHFLSAGADPSPLGAETHEEDSQYAGRLNELIRKCCAFEQKDRYETVSEVKEELSRIETADDGAVIRIGDKTKEPLREPAPEHKD